MKIIISIVLLLLWIPALQAKQCMVGSITDPKMYLKYEDGSQTATSFKVSCDHAYGIRFGSQNLRDSSGNSYVTNGRDRLKTRMSISGAGSNLWNVSIPQSANLDNKYVIFVQLDEHPSALIPAGMYTDRIYIDLAF